ncbi:hypothetical protein ACFL2V_02070 [Pseudomonadota bacterium]
MSNSISAMTLGIQGIQKGMKDLRQNAHEIANANQNNKIATRNTTDVTEPLIEMKLNKLQIETSAKVIQTSSDMIGTLLDIKA